MNIMGIHEFGHDSGVALIADGRLMSIGEERLNRNKHCGGFPELSVAYLLQAAGIHEINDVDLIVGLTRLDRNGVERFEASIRKMLGYRGNVHTISHHDAHAASAFYPSPFEEAAVMVVDGLGSQVNDLEIGKPLPFINRIIDKKDYHRCHEVQSFYRAKNGTLSSIRKDYSLPEYQNGLGLVYMATSVFLNFGDFGSGKVMGLAPYGGVKGKSMTRDFCDIVDGAVLTESEKNFVNYVDRFQKRFYPNVPIRKKETLPDDLYTEIAYSVQEATEQALIEIANYLHRISPSENLCYAGGVGLNSVANKKILDNSPFANIFIQPAACDSGIALGCALWGAHMIAGENPKKYRFKNAYLGRPYGEEEILTALKTTPNIRFSREKNIVGKAARMLADGKIIGWFQGGSEAGPRALGHRSILCDPSKPDMKDVLNARVKHRESFRPFAPSVLMEHAFDYFEISCESPYMLLIAKVKEDKQRIVPAITHVDGTARVQTVTKKDNGRYYDLIKEFHSITKIPVILNTSFNIAGEPIVETPADAIRCFMSTEMDYLCIEDYFIEAAGPKDLVRGPVVDENRLKADDIRGVFSWFKAKG